MAKKKKATPRRILKRQGVKRPTKRTIRRIPRAGALCILIGVVLDKSSGLPVNNALVKIVAGSDFGRETHTNAFGLYVFTNLTPGRHLIEASKGTKIQEKDKTLTIGINVLNFSI
jgi:hypothetical protein